MKPAGGGRPTPARHQGKPPGSTGSNKPMPKAGPAKKLATKPTTTRQTGRM